jgi:hypothetical protein
MPNRSPAVTVIEVEAALSQFVPSALIVQASAVAVSLSVTVNVIVPPRIPDADDISAIKPLIVPLEGATISHAVWLPAAGVHDVASELYQGVVLFGGQTDAPLLLPCIPFPTNPDGP